MHACESAADAPSYAFALLPSRQREGVPAITADQFHLSSTFGRSGVATQHPNGEPRCSSFLICQLPKKVLVNAMMPNKKRSVSLMFRSHMLRQVQFMTVCVLKYDVGTCSKIIQSAHLLSTHRMRNTGRFLSNPATHDPVAVFLPHSFDPLPASPSNATARSPPHGFELEAAAVKFFTEIHRSRWSSVHRD